MPSRRGGTIRKGGGVMTGLLQLNVELSSKCSKSCWMCGRRERDRLYGPQEYGNMEMDTVREIAAQLPEGIIVATHNNGESMLHPHFGECVKTFKEAGAWVYTVTNGKHLMERFDEIVGNLDAVSVSVIQNDDPDEKEFQYETLLEFLKRKGSRIPQVTIRTVGNVDDPRLERLNLPIIRRVLHLPKGSVGYTRPPTIPEHGVCMDLLTRMAIDRQGTISVCVRFDPEGALRLGTVAVEGIGGCWNGEKRQSWKHLHMTGQRNAVPYCGDRCEYWGVPVG